MPTDAHLTNPLIWLCTGILAVADALLILLARRQITRGNFSQLQWYLIIGAGGFFFLVWTSALLWAWDWFYSFIFPAQARYLLPFVFLIFYMLIALVMTWLSIKLPGNPAVTWCILGGVEGLLSHVYAIYGLGAASKPPIMHGTDPIVVLIFAFFEITFYFSLILLGSSLIWRFKQHRVS